MAYGGIFGPGATNAAASSLFGQQGIASHPGQLQNAYQQGGLNSNYHAQQALQRQYAAAQQAQLNPQWMIDGRSMSLQDFATEVFGDTPERTMFLLKYTKEE